MRKLIGILVCLWIVAEAFAITYEPCVASDFRSTSSYMSSGYQTLDNQAIARRTAPMGSLSSISASNFESLNSEDGLIGANTTAIRSGRPGGGGDSGGAIGEYDFSSPVGEVPLVLLLLFAVAFAIRKRPERQQR